MLVQSIYRAGARLTTVVVVLMAIDAVLLGLCASVTPAWTASSLELPLPKPNAPVRLAALEAGNLRVQPSTTLPPVNQSPFGLTGTDNGSFASRWRNLQPLLAIERQILAFCRTAPAGCPARAAKFLAIIEAAHADNGRARVGKINRAINLAIRPMSDIAQYGVPDLWASPLMTLGSGAGDCEDYAIAKYVALREVGMATEDLRLVVVYNRPAHENHMVAAARVDGRWLILDNRTMRLAADDEITDLVPLAVLNSADPSPVIAAEPTPLAAEASAGAWDAAGFASAL